MGKCKGGFSFYDSHGKCLWCYICTRTVYFQLYNSRVWVIENDFTFRLGIRGPISTRWQNAPPHNSQHMGSASDLLGKPVNCMFPPRLGNNRLRILRTVSEN